MEMLPNKYTSGKGQDQPEDRQVMRGTGEEYPLSSIQYHPGGLLET